MRRLFKPFHDRDATPDRGTSPEDGLAPADAERARRRRVRRSGPEALVGTPLSATRELLDRLDRDGVRTRLSIRGSLDDLPEVTGVAAQVVVQEALENAADDHMVDVRFRQEGQDFAVTVYSVPRQGVRLAAERRSLTEGAVRDPLAAAHGTLMSRGTAGGWIVAARFPTGASVGS